MCSIQALLGLAQLERIDELIARKRELFGWYKERLGNIDGLTLNAEPTGAYNSYWMVTVVLDPKPGGTKEQLITYLNDYGIACRPFSYPLSSLPAYLDVARAVDAQIRNQIAYQVTHCGINLPSALNLHFDQVEHVC